MNIIYKSRGIILPRNPQRIFICCNYDNNQDILRLKDFIFKRILEENIVVSWLDPKDAEIEPEILTEELKETQVFVFLVAEELRDRVSPMFSLAQKTKTPIIPIVKSTYSLLDFSDKFGSLHAIAVDDIEYEQKLENHLKRLIVPDELTKQINMEAFTAKAFLSYRKKDIEKSRRLMEAIHNIDGYKALSIWYDAFLTLGENFNSEIASALNDSDLFLLLVTPKLLETDNYVQKIEYPLASEKAKPILPVEAEFTNKENFKSLFPMVGDVVDIDNTIVLKTALHTLLNKTAFVDNLDLKFDSKRSYLLGMAYINGIGIEKDFKRGIELLRDASGHSDIFAMKAASQLADYSVSGILGKIDYSLEVMWRKRAVEISQQIFDSQDIQFLDNRFRLAVSLMFAGDYPNALKEHLEVLRYRTIVLSTEHKEIADSYDNIALVLQNMDVFDESLKYHHKACQYREKIFGKISLHTAISYNNIAVAYKNLKDYENAVIWNKETIDILLNLYGDGYPLIATAYCNLATILNHMQKYEASIEWHNKALKIREKVLGIHHPDVGISYNNIGKTYLEINQPSKALEYFIKDKDISETIFGFNHPQTGISYQSIGVAHYVLKDFEKALDYLCKAYRIWVKIYDEDDDHIKTCCQAMGHAYVASGRDPNKIITWMINIEKG